MVDSLKRYRAKRDFTTTPEPDGDLVEKALNPRPDFVVQKHAASHLHYDVRLEIGGVMKSWSVPKGPSLDPAIKRLAIEVEDHPIGYNRFEGVIPAGQYGGGTVMLWDRGAIDTPRAELAEGFRAGRIDFSLDGARLKGRFTLLRMRDGDGARAQWLLFKRRDAHAAPGSDVTSEHTTSVTTRRTMEQIARPSTQGPSVLEQLDRIEGDGASGELRFEGDATLPVTHLDRVVFPKSGVTKGGLMRYYARVAPVLLPLLRDRPLALKRFPRGVGGASFFQQEPSNWPSSVRTAKVRLEDGVSRPRLVGGDLATLLYTVQLGAISVHPWQSRIGSLATPDTLVLDLDPGPEVGYDRVVEIALTARDVLSAHGMTATPKTSGATGLHVVGALPRKMTWKTVAKLAESLAREVADAHPTHATLTRLPPDRPKGTVYVDFLQNARGKTVVSAWSVRATPDATVSVPLDWAELTPDLDPRAFTLDVALRRAVPSTAAPSGR